MNSPLRAVLAAALLAGLPLPACGPDFSPPEYTRKREPEDPARFLAGRLDVLSPDLRTGWQVVAWRRLSGLAMPKVDPAAIDPTFVGGTDPVYEAIVAWREARKSEVPAPQEPFISPDAYLDVPTVDENGNPYTDSLPYLNCPADAFRTAVATLADRRASFRPDHPGILAWIEAQDAVFAACGGDAPPPVREPEPRLPEKLAADRRYQIAAASFYAGRYDDARTRFLAIAKEKDSPWSGISPYLATRALVRQATLVPGPADREKLSRADAELSALIADSTRGGVREPARRLREWIAIRARPAERTAELAKDLSARELSSEAVGQQIADYAYLLRHAQPGESADPLTEWIETWSAPEGKGATRALERWRKEKSLPWLVAALSLAPDDGKAPADLLDAAAALKDDSPAKATATFERARLLIAAGDRAGARKDLDRLLAGDLSRGSENRAKSLRLRIAGSLDDLARDGVQMRLSGGPDDDEATREERYLTGEAAFWWNRRLPLSAFEAAAAKVTNVDLRARLGEAAWTRAVLLGDTAAAERAAQALGEEVPEIAAWAAASAADRPAAAAWALIRNPGLAPLVEGGFPRWGTVAEVDDYRRNFWCAQWPTEVLEEDRSLHLPALPERPGFLSAAESATADREIQTLQDLGDGYDIVAGKVLAWARERPADANVPEALYLASQRARVASCRADKPNLSKAAFDLLKKSYPKSEWAKKAKYWY